jgi:GT2 family glycosyltransferase
VDGSVEFIKKKYPGIKIIELKKNTGFAYANNLGIKEAFKNQETKFIVTLNNDTKVDKEYLYFLVKEAKNNIGAGSFQPKVINFFDKDVIDGVGILIYKDGSAINRGQKEKDSERYQKKEEIFGPSASAALYTRKALQKTRLPNGDYFDSDYFAYYEDVDLAWRMRLFGFQSFYIPEARVFHVHSATGKNYSPFKAFHIHRNQYYNIIKDFSGKFFWRALFFMIIRYFYLISSIFKKTGPAAKLNKNINQINDQVVFLVFRAWWSVIINLPKMIEKRKYIQCNKKVSKKEIEKWFKEYGTSIENMIYK